jgi:Methyltransferase domain
VPTASLAESYRRARLRLPQPWSRRLGLLAYLPQLARGDRDTRLAFAEEASIERTLREDLPLERLGAGLSERVVEIPWALRALPRGAGVRVLDVGTAFAPIVYKRQLIRLPQAVEVVDLAAARIGRLPSHVADIRRLPFAERSFDAALCISTLEHIGMDNEHYDIASGGAGDVAALRSLGRVAARVLVTVPGGDDHDFGWFRQYSPATFRGRVEAAGLAVERLDVFAHDPTTGWRLSDESSIAGLLFGQDSYSAAAVICAQLSGHSLDRRARD